MRSIRDQHSLGSPPASPRGVDWTVVTTPSSIEKEYRFEEFWPGGWGEVGCFDGDQACGFDVAGEC
jgi:hypothetical protein